MLNEYIAACKCLKQKFQCLWEKADREEAVKSMRGVREIIYYDGGFVNAALMISVLSRRERDSHNVLSCFHYLL